MKRIEALADAIAAMNGAQGPLSDAYRLRNPGLLKAFAPKHPRDDKGRRVFVSLVAGYENLLLDLRLKCTGRTRARLSSDSPLVDLLTTYGNPASSARYVVNFLRHALADNDIPAGVKLGWFAEGENTNAD